MIIRILISVAILLVANIGFTSPAWAQCDCETDCSIIVEGCGATCGNCFANQGPGTKQQFTDELENHKTWLVDIFWMDREPNDAPGLLAAIQLMTSQLISNALQQTKMIGSIFDAKHQLETQRLFQQLSAQAHKDYHPNEKLCEVGTVARPLAASERKSNITTQYLSQQNLDRQLHSHDDQDGPLIEDSNAKDRYSRLKDYILTFCNKQDNAQNLDLLCASSEAIQGNKNLDIDYTELIDSKLTLDVEMVDDSATTDEIALFALLNNLVAEEIPPNVAAGRLVTRTGHNRRGERKPSYGGAAVRYLDSRALAAKRSVATNSLASIAALKAKGDPVSDSFIYAIIKELNPEFSTEEITAYIGENPSYYAQMEVLTKKIYQQPNFYAELYDKPANVKRKDVAILAAELMQKRDIYRSLLRSEAVLAVMLEATLIPQQDEIRSNLVGSREQGIAAETGNGG